MFTNLPRTYMQPTLDERRTKKKKKNKIYCFVCLWILFVAQELCERCFCGGGGGLCVCGSRSELRSCVKVQVAVLGSPSLIVLTVSVDVEEH